MQVSQQVALGQIRDLTLTGVIREWFRLVTAEMFNPDNALFTLSVEGNRMQPNSCVPVFDTLTPNLTPLIAPDYPTSIQIT